MYSFLILAGAIASSGAFIDYLKNLPSSNCTDNDFICANNLQCIPMAKRCDKTIDCSDFSDEEDCETVNCEEPNFFRCKNNRCVSSVFVCDGENDCEDFSDEQKCENFQNNFQTNSTCKEKQWQCTDRLCIPEEWVCNGESDCLDGSDEILGCSSNIECDGFKCKNGHCIAKEWRCDGQDDCRDNSDETDCKNMVDPKDCTFDNQRFLCADGKTCIKLSEVCNEIPQCPDKSDESASCKISCNNYTCSHDCISLPTGPKCICPKGYHTIDEKHCQDINECETYGICDQKCKNLPGSYECLCDESYSLKEDKKNCKAHFGEAIMFFSSKKEIRAYLMKSEIYFPVAKNLRQVVGVDYDGRYVYWTDIFSEHESIVRSLKNGTERELIVTSGLGAPEDIHIDHITNNIYFTDAERQHIGVCTKDGTHCTVLVNKDVQKPRGIVLYPEQGEMYWTDWGHTPEIARAFMDGSDDMSFVSNDIHWPNGLTIDYPNERLYWTDAKLATLESIRLDGTDRRVVLEGVVKHPYAIAVFENRLYWSDWATHSIQSCDKFTGKNHHTLIKENKDFIYGISIYHPNLRKKPMINPCVLSFCSDICLLHGPSTYTCACPQDKELSIDRHTCKDLGKKQKLILGAHNMLIRVEHQLLGKHEITALPVLIKKIGALAYNSVNHSLYISDLEIRKIISLDLHSGTSMPLAIWDLGQVVAMDYDYLGNNLYWCDAERKTIEVVNLNTMSRKILLHDMHGESPESIALVPEEGVMFVALQKYNRRETHIDRIFMDGTSRTHPVEHGILGPINLYYDNDLHRVFISDAGTGNIETTSVEGDDRHGFRSLQTSPIGITTLKNDLFWVNENSRRLYWANKYNTDDHDHNKKITLDLPDDIDRMYITSITPKRIGLSPCQNRNGGCSHLCLHSQKSIICACPIGMSLDEDNHTCIKRVECISDEFFCGKSNHCISNKFRCDGVKNCQNGEDEDDCKVANHCPLDSFQCEDGECVKETARCDQHYDCRDKSDEHNCSRREARTCPPKHFKCHDGKCINERLVCDALKDCEDGEDEDNCLSTVCKDGEFRCLSGACIPKSWECDHEYDCPDFSDEHAHCATCSPNMFTCANSKCIDKGFVCDNENDCGDNSDETSCDKQEETCNQGEFSCASHQHVCLPIVARCNGTSECPHHEDEQNCSDCGVEEFTCNNKKCIATQWVCDHSDDCGDGSDEASSLCSHDSASSAKSHLPCHDSFQCSNGNCIDYSLVCNREPNCYDGSDEEGVCNTSCNSMNNPCGQICQKTPTGPMCKCEQGYRLQGDAQNCEDIDECKNQPPVCSQLCHNLPGTYICDCYEGFLLKSDKMSCKAEGTAMSMIFTSDNQIRELSQMENSLKLIYLEDTPKITGLDVDIKNSTIYFSIESSGTIHRINKKSSQLEYMQIGQPQKLSLDWITNNIYFVNNEPNSKAISICNFDSKTCANLIPIDIHRQVSAITIDAINKFIFYSVASWWMFNSPNYVIYKANLDGTGRHELIKSTSGYITGLTFDLNKKELFYVDQHKGQLGKITYDGLFNSVLQSNLTRPVGLNFYENHLFFLTSGGYMEKCRLYIPSNCDSFKLNTYSNELFAIVQESRQPEIQDSCKNHTCSHLCIPTKLHYKCLCEDGKLITADEECANKERTMVSNGGKRLLAIHQYQADSDSSPNLGPMIAGIIISFCLLILSVVFYYIVRKRNSGSFNISMRFHNPAYGLHTDEAEKSILQPGQHEYSNPVDFYETETESNKKTALLVDV